MAEPTAGAAHGEDFLRATWRRSLPGLLAIGLFSFFINLLKLAAPLFILQVLDRVLASRSLETLFLLTAITLIAIVSGVLLEVVRRRLFMHWGHWLERRFGPALFITGLNGAGVKRPPVSKLLRDLGTVRGFVAGQGLIAWLDVIWAPLFIGVVYLISPALGMLVLVGSLIALVLGTAYELLTRESRNATLKARKDDLEWIAAAERNRDTVGSLAAILSLSRRWSASAFRRLEESMRTRGAQVYLSAALRLVGRLIRIGVLGLGIWLVLEHELTLGAVIAAGVLGRTAYSLVRSAMLKWRDLVSARRAWRRVRAVVAGEPPAAVSLSSADEPAPLRFQDIAYRYPHQAKSLIRGIDLELQPGELLCFLGPTASGKTTFCRLAAGLLEPRSGRILLGGVAVHRLQRHSAERRIGYLPQEITLFQGTVRENISSLGDGDMDAVVEAARLAGIHETILNLPHGYDTPIVDDEPLLSAGQRKSIAVARALYGRPPLIVLDEPMSYLDGPLWMALMSSLMWLKSQGTVIVLASQGQVLARIADKVITQRDGRFRLLDGPEQIAGLWGGPRERIDAKPRKRSGKRRSRKRSGKLEPVKS